MGWIGVDFDHTLATYHKGMYPKLGEPIPAMVERVKRWIAKGYEVRIVTARVEDRGWLALHYTKTWNETFENRKLIEDWTEKHIGTKLQVTNAKDYEMIFLVDDRAIRVVAGTGEIVGATPEELWLKDE